MANKDEPLADLPNGAFCNHETMAECCEGCGHFHCPSCGLTWDEFAEGSWELEDADDAPQSPVEIKQNKTFAIIDVELANGNFITAEGIEQDPKHRTVVVTDAGGNILGCWKPKDSKLIQVILSRATDGQYNE